MFCPLLAGASPFDGVKRSADRKEQVDNADHQSSKQCAKQSDGNIGNEKLGDPDDDGTRKKTDRSFSEGGNFSTKQRLHRQTEHCNDEGEEQSAPETSDRKAGHDPADKQQYDGSDDKSHDMGKQFHGYQASFLLILPEQKLKYIRPYNQKITILNIPAAFASHAGIRYNRIGKEGRRCCKKYCERWNSTKS
jgi:hypothetical protein